MRLLTILILIISTKCFAKGKFGPEFEPYLSATRGTFKFENAYSGSITAAGAGLRIGTSLGPLYLAGEASGQIPFFYADHNDIAVSVRDVSPMPNTDPWLSYGFAIGLKTRILSLVYTYIFDSSFKSEIRHEQAGLPDEKYEYTYNGNGHKVAAMIHLTENFSVGAEMASYKFNKYSLGKDTHVVNAGNKKDRSKLEVTGYSLLINYSITVELM